MYTYLSFFFQEVLTFGIYIRVDLIFTLHSGKRSFYIANSGLVLIYFPLHTGPDTVAKELLTSAIRGVTVTGEPGHRGVHVGEQASRWQVGCFSRLRRQRCLLR